MKGKLSKDGLTKEDIIEILESQSSEDEALLFSKAREVRERVFGNKIFLYGFVYFSTWCRNNCSFCYFRNSSNIERYRKTEDEILDISRQLTESGVNLIDLTMGEDPEYHKDGFETLFKVVERIKKELDMPVMISPGYIENKLIDRFANMGADWYALYQETHNRELFSRMRINQDYDQRMNCKLYAKEKGMLIEEGLMAGIGETTADIADSLVEMGRIGAKQIRVMSFVPQKGSPMENVENPDRTREMRIIALMRIMYPHALIPASLDVDGIKGLKDRVNAGASVVTSIIPPKSGFMGVAQGSMDVDEGGRTFKEAAAILNDMGLATATTSEYKAYLDVLRSM